MAVISSIANKKACSGVNGANTGKLGCLQLFGTPEHMLLWRKGTVVPAAADITIEYLTPLIQKGIVVPLIGASAFEDVSAEDTYSTNSSGIKRLNLKGLPEYKLMFEEGHEFYRQLSKLEGYKNWDVWIGDDGGNWMLVERSDGDYAGFTAGHTTPELTARKVKGGDAESKSFVVQFLERMEWDENYVLLHQDELGFLPNEIPSVNGVTLTFDAVPADAATSADVTIVLASDNNTPVEGLQAANFQVTINGTVDATGLVTDNGAGSYAVGWTTAVSTSDVLGIQLYDASQSADVADHGGVLYRSELVTVTI